MIVCPKCGGDTRVEHTYQTNRERICKDITCNARLRTIEVPSSDLMMVRKLLAAIDGRVVK